MVPDKGVRRWLDALALVPPDVEVLIARVAENGCFL